MTPSRRMVAYYAQVGGRVERVVPSGPGWFAEIRDDARGVHLGDWATSPEQALADARETLARFMRNPCRALPRFNPLHLH